VHVKLILNRFSNNPNLLKSFFQLLLGFICGIIILIFLSNTPRNKFFFSPGVFLTQSYAWLLIIVIFILSAGIAVGALRIANLDDSSMTTLVRVSLALAIVLSFGDLLFSTIQFTGINIFRWLLPLLLAVITKMIFTDVTNIRTSALHKPAPVRTVWAIFAIIALILTLVFVILPAPRPPDVIQLYIPMLDAFKSPGFSPNNPDQSNLWWYFLSRGRGLDTFFAKEFGADLHPFVSILFLISASLSSAALAQSILPLSINQSRSGRLIPPLTAILVLSTPTFPSVIGRFHTESFSVLVSFVFSVAILLKQNSKLAIFLSITSSLLIILQVPIMAVIVIFIWLLFSFFTSGSLKKRICALTLATLSGCWGLTVVLLNINAVGIGEVSPFQIFRSTANSKLQEWTSLDYLEYLNYSQGFSNILISSSFSVVNNSLALLRKWPLFTTNVFSFKAILSLSLILILLMVSIGAGSLRNLGLKGYQIRISGFLLTIAVSLILSQIFFSNGSLERLLFGQFNLIILFIIFTSVLLSRIAIPIDFPKLFPRLLALFIAINVFLGLANLVSSPFYSLPRTHSVMQRFESVLTVLAGSKVSVEKFVYEPWVNLEICEKLIQNQNSLDRILILNSATLYSPLCFAQYHQIAGKKFVETLDVEVGRHFYDIMSQDPQLIRSAFDQTGVKEFIVFRNDAKFFGFGLSPIFGPDFLEHNVYVKASTLEFYILTLDPKFGRPLDNTEIDEILKLRELTRESTPYFDGLVVLDN